MMRTSTAAVFAKAVRAVRTTCRCSGIWSKIVRQTPAYTGGRFLAGSALLSTRLCTHFVEESTCKNDHKIKISPPRDGITTLRRSRRTRSPSIMICAISSTVGTRLAGNLDGYRQEGRLRIDQLPQPGIVGCNSGQHLHKIEVLMHGIGLEAKIRRRSSFVCLPYGRRRRHISGEDDPPIHRRSHASNA